MELTVDQEHLIRSRLEGLRTIAQRRDFLRMAEEEWLVELHPEWRSWKDKSAFEALGHMVVFAMVERMKKMERLTGRGL